MRTCHVKHVSEYLGDLRSLVPRSLHFAKAAFRRNPRFLRKLAVATDCCVEDLQSLPVEAHVNCNVWIPLSHIQYIEWASALVPPTPFYTAYGMICNDGPWFQESSREMQKRKQGNACRETGYMKGCKAQYQAHHEQMMPYSEETRNLSEPNGYTYFADQRYAEENSWEISKN